MTTKIKVVIYYSVTHVKKSLRKITTKRKPRGFSQGEERASVYTVYFLDPDGTRTLITAVGCQGSIHYSMRTSNTLNTVM